MSTDITRQMGWKPIPLVLKILCVVMIMWVIGSATNLPNLMETGLPVFGKFVFGTGALIVVLFLDFIGPLVFVYALWNRKLWGVGWAVFYIGLFILNGTVALLTVSDQLGLTEILVPNLASFLFLALILWNRSYFASVD